MSLIFWQLQILAWGCTCTGLLLSAGHVFKRVLLWAGFAVACLGLGVLAARAILAP